MDSDAKELGHVRGPLARPLGDTSDRMWLYIPALATTLPIENLLLTRMLKRDKNLQGLQLGLILARRRTP